MQIKVLLTALLLLAAGCAGLPGRFHAVGDGHALASPAINRAIAAAHAAGGGTVELPAGQYRCYSIHLMSDVSLYLDRGCTIVAARRIDGQGYDAAEPCSWDEYQDFGHSHFHNSLIWGENLQNVSILGPGTIDGTALSDGNVDRIEKIPTTDPQYLPIDPRDTVTPTPKEGNGPPKPWLHYRLSDHLKSGVGNKAIALKNCRNVTLRDFAVLRGGHFAILATGVDNLTIDNLKLDTNRDGMDIDCCQNVRVSNCSVNSPNDDGICLKSSFALGYRRATENVTITNCYVTGGYRIGSLLDGSWQRFSGFEYQGHTGRIKFGTESNGGFKRIAVTNCVFDYCGGLAIESEDGAIVEDITVSNLAMHDIVNCPIFIRLGNRARGPESPPAGVVRRISIDNVVASHCNWRYGSIISGFPGHPVEDISISNVHFLQQGGGTSDERNLDPPERERRYPDPNMFGTMPAYGFFIRHAKNVTISNAQIATETPDDRPLGAFWDVDNIDLNNVSGSNAAFKSVDSAFSLKGASHLHFHRVLGLNDSDQAAASTQPYIPTTEPADPVLDKAF